MTKEEFIEKIIEGKVLPVLNAEGKYIIKDGYQVRIVIDDNQGFGYATKHKAMKGYLYKKQNYRQGLIANIEKFIKELE